MKSMLLAFATLLLAMATTARAAIKTQEIEYKDGDTVLQGFLAYDDSVTGKRPGILVCHEWWGVNDYTRSRAQQLAQLGYVAFALDMYGKGVVTDNPAEAQKLATKLYSDSSALRRRAAAGLKVLADQKNVDPSKLAAIGYCMGGKVALELARSGADLRALVSFHGALSTDTPARPGDLKPHILICHGADDTFISPEEQSKFLQEMKDAKADFEFVQYAGAVHGFTNPNADKYNIPGLKYNKKADERSWAHMQRVFNEAFGPPKERS